MKQEKIKLFEKHSIVAYGLKTYLSVVSWDGLSPEHCYIAPMAHCASLVQMDEDVYEEMKLWMKGLVAMWRDEKGEDGGMDCVFVETAINIREQQHMSIECIPLPKELGELAPIYFKKAIMESEKEWSNNQKLIDLAKTSKANVRGTIPKGFPYFTVNFGLQPGFAHVVEDERKFPSNFAQEIIGGMLDLPHNHWRKPKKQSFDQIMERRNKLKEKWTKYDWTEIVRRELNEGGETD
ncbi:hypothetical protein niasHS_006757 [Heterodera schachtii]|uniref:CWF19-like protein 2 n=1 Tax=Heterodera schachtii TaxID=97005 RepID=A0ABD2JI62_HETSC